MAKETYQLVIVGFFLAAAFCSSACASSPHRYGQSRDKDFRPRLAELLDNEELADKIVRYANRDAVEPEDEINFEDALAELEYELSRNETNTAANVKSFVEQESNKKRSCEECPDCGLMDQQCEQKCFEKACQSKCPLCYRFCHKPQPKSCDICDICMEQSLRTTGLRRHPRHAESISTNRRHYVRRRPMKKRPRGEWFPAIQRGNWITDAINWIVNSLRPDDCKCETCKTQCQCTDTCPDWFKCELCPIKTLECPCGKKVCICDAKKTPDLRPSHTSTDQNVCKGASCAFRDTCGKAKLNTLLHNQAYILDGKPEKYGSWPQYVHLQIENDGWRICGGVLISNKHVLTAGHCLEDRMQKNAAIKPWQVVPILGDHNIETVDAHEDYYNVKSVCLASNFVENMMGTKYDFGVLELDREVKFSDYAQPACLPYEPVDYNRTDCYVMGLGTYKFNGEVGELATVVQELQVDNIDCGFWLIKPDDESRTCFHTTKSKGDTCNGDSGGPVLCANNLEKRWTVAGLVSYGSGDCQGKAGVGYTAVYAKVHRLLNQIKRECGV